MTDTQKLKLRKIVQIAKIVNILHGLDGARTAVFETGPHLPMNGPQFAEAEIGGYFVWHEDGYNSYSPAGAFEKTARAPTLETFTQPKITGYRQLNADEAALMNEAKALGTAFDELIGRLKAYHGAQKLKAGTARTPEHEAERQRLLEAEPERWLAMGRTDIQVGIMKIVRSIAQPASF